MKAPLSNDTDLFLRVKKGDNEAFGQLFRKYYPKVLTISYRFLADRQRAEDLAQEVFLKAYNAAKTFVPKAKFSTWLHTITVNTCLTYQKRHARELEKITTEADLVFSEDANDVYRASNHSSSALNFQLTLRPDEHAQQKETEREVHAALKQVPPDQRIALILLEYKGLSYQEIAKACGCSTKAVERRIYHARQKLRELLARNNYSVRT